MKEPWIVFCHDPVSGKEVRMRDMKKLYLEDTTSRMVNRDIKVQCPGSSITQEEWTLTLAVPSEL